LGGTDKVLLQKKLTGTGENKIALTERKSIDPNI
jgi:hypothetical protein